MLCSSCIGFLKRRVESKVYIRIQSAQLTLKSFIGASASSNGAHANTITLHESSDKMNLEFNLLCVRMA